MMKKILVFLGCIPLIVMQLPSGAKAAQFCMGGYGMALQCIYDDAAGCLEAQDPPGTFCTVNPEAVLNYSGNGRYCAVSSGQVAECIYSDRSQCNTEANRRRGVCIDRVTMQDKYNPYKGDPRIQY